MLPLNFYGESAMKKQEIAKSQGMGKAGGAAKGAPSKGPIDKKAIEQSKKKK